MSDQGSGMYTDVESSGKKLLEYDDTVRVGKQRFLFSHLQHSLFKNPLEQVLVSVAGGNCLILESLSDGGLLLRAYTAPAEYWLVYPDGPQAAPSFWVRFVCWPPQEDEAEYTLKLAYQQSLALSHMRGQRERSWRDFQANR